MFPFPNPFVSGSVAGASTGGLPFVKATFEADTHPQCPFPTGIESGDILFFHSNIQDPIGSADVSALSDAGFALVGRANGNDNFGSLWWKRADGTESGILTATLTEGVDLGGLAEFTISTWRGCTATGTPYEAFASNVQASTTSHVGSSITTLGANRQVVTFYGCQKANTVGDNTNGWTEEFEFSTSTGSNGNMSGNSILQATAGTVAANTRTMLAACRNISFTLALILA